MAKSRNFFEIPVLAGNENFLEMSYCFLSFDDFPAARVPPIIDL